MSSKKKPAGASVAVKPPVQPVQPTQSTPPAPQADGPQPAGAHTPEGSDPLPMATYRVRGDLVSVAFGDQVYPVRDGRVDLPAGARWYAHLVQSGRLFQDTGE